MGRPNKRRKPGHGSNVVHRTRTSIDKCTNLYSQKSSLTVPSLLAQLVERETVNLKVVGSIPTRGVFWRVSR